MNRFASSIVFVSLLVGSTNVNGFVVALTQRSRPTGRSIPVERRQRINNEVALWMNNRNDAPSGDDTDDADDIVTKEMFLRDALQAPSDAASENDDVIVKKKRKKGSQKEYKVMDNRDRLPFSITVQTPDPYTHPDIKKKNAVTAKKTRRDAIEDQMIASTLYRTSGSSNENGSTTPDPTTWLGEFSLDKHTTTGDSIILASGMEYKVVRHRCLYKYGGGQRFVMVRKILEVKEVGRLLSEQYLQRQWHSGSSSSSAASLPLNETEGGL